MRLKNKGVPRSIHSRETGATFAEFAIVFPLLFFLLLTFIDFGRFYFYRGLGSSTAQRAVSLTQVISGLPDVNLADVTNPGAADKSDDSKVLGAIVAEIKDFIEDSVGVPISDDESNFVHIYNETGQRPFLVLPALGAGETLAERLEIDPLEIQFLMRMRTFSPWLPALTVNVNAAGYWDGTKRSSIPVATDCDGNVLEGFNPPAAVCNCPGFGNAAVIDPDTNTCVCTLAGLALGACDCPGNQVFNPSAGQQGECQCEPCPDSANTTQANDDSCTCTCTSTGDFPLDFDQDVCTCPYGLEVTGGRACVCPADRVNDCADGEYVGYNPNGTTLEDICPCLGCPVNQELVADACVCKDVSEISGCPIGSEITNATSCTCECPNEQQDVAGTCECVITGATAACDGGTEIVGDSTACTCDDCPEGEIASDDNESCECPTEAADQQSVCTGSDEIFNGGASCSCVPCPARRQAQDNNTACYCPKIQDSSGATIPANGCPHVQQIVNGTLCKCEWCPSRFRADDTQLDCYCPLVEDAAGTPRDAEDACPGVTSIVNATTCLCNNCPGGQLQNASGDGCKCPEAGDDITQVCTGSSQIYNGSCGCSGCPSNFRADTTNLACYCPLVEDASGTPRDPEDACPGATSVVNATTCTCDGCPDGQIENATGDGCRCPEAGDDLTQVCSGNNEFYDGACGCNPCPTGQIARPDNLSCYCPLVEDAAGTPIDAETACPGNTSILNAGICACEDCPVAGEEQQADGKSCYCPLTDGVTDFTTICTDGDEIFNGACGCEDCPDANPDSDATNLACTCELLDAAGGDRRAACGDTSRFEDCDCIACPTDTTPDASADGLSCVCQVLVDAGSTTGLCTDDDEFFDAADCNNCGNCPTDHESNGSNTGCDCALTAQICAGRGDNGSIVNTGDCTCEPCPDGRAPNAAGDSCDCIATCGDGDPSGGVVNDACVCECPDGQRAGTVTGFGYRCFRTCCFGVGDTFQCDTALRCPGEDGYDPGDIPE